jgi:hypothetical protein
VCAPMCSQENSEKCGNSYCAVLHSVHGCEPGLRVRGSRRPCDCTSLCARIAHVE